MSAATTTAALELAEIIDHRSLIQTRLNEAINTISEKIPGSEEHLAYSQRARNLARQLDEVEQKINILTPLAKSEAQLQEEADAAASAAHAALISRVNADKLRVDAAIAEINDASDRLTRALLVAGALIPPIASDLEKYAAYRVSGGWSSVLPKPYSEGVVSKLPWVSTVADGATLTTRGRAGKIG